MKKIIILVVASAVMCGCAGQYHEYNSGLIRGYDIASRDCERCENLLKARDAEIAELRRTNEIIGKQLIDRNIKTVIVPNIHDVTLPCTQKNCPNLFFKVGGEK